MKNVKTFLLISILLFAVACQTTQTTDTGIIIDSQVDPNLYTVVLELEEPVGGYAESNLRLTTTDGRTSGVVWDNGGGKGIVRGTLLSVEPNVNFVDAGDTTVVKTTDWKVTGLLPGDTVTLICIADFEPVCAKSTSANTAGECIDMWEFDYCRLDSITPLETGR